MKACMEKAHRFVSSDGRISLRGNELASKSGPFLSQYDLMTIVIKAIAGEKLAAWLDQR